MSEPANKFFAHESCYIDDGAEIGEGTRIWHFSHVMSGARVGANCNIGQNVVIHSTAVVGNGVKIQNNISVYDGVVLEDNVFCGPSMVFTNVINPRSHTPRKQEYMKTLVRQGATIGANATVLCGNSIGKHAFIGAASLVSRDVPDFGLVFGIPAKLQGWMCKCGVRLDLPLCSEGKTSTCCEVCGRSYEQEGRKVALIAEPSE